MINGRKIYIPGMALLSLLFSETAHATVEAKSLFSASGMINLVILICVLIGLLWSIKIMSLVKGGLMSKSWQMFSLGFAFLIIARFLIVIESINAFTAPEPVITILYLLMIITWLMGIYQTKKILA